MAISHEEVQFWFDYQPDTGWLIWRTSPKHDVKVGDRAGCDRGDGRWVVKVRQKMYLTSRLAWFWMTGEWPSGEVDHKDRNRSNDVWTNLRDVPKSVNNQNKAVQHRNTSGVVGVDWNKQKGKWRARLSLKRKIVYLGWFDTFEEAVQARKAGEKAQYSLP
jgi:hypothetical protein